MGTKEDKLMNICEQFIVLKYAFHGAIEQIFREDFGKDKQFRDNMIKYTKNELLNAGIKMMESQEKKEAKELYELLRKDVKDE